MKSRFKTKWEKEAIIAEYLNGLGTCKELGLKHGVDYRTLNHWVRKFQGRVLKKEKRGNDTGSDSEDRGCTPTIKELQAELHKARLHNELLNAIIDVAEDRFKIDIRKKSGTKR